MHEPLLRLAIVAVLFGIGAQGCGDGGGGDGSHAALSVAELTGNYDATLTPTPASASATGTDAVGATNVAVGVVGAGTQPGEGSLAITIYDRGLNRIRVSGDLQDDGSIALDGQQQSNIQGFVHGSATVVAADGTERISGSLELANGLNTFTLERPSHVDLRGFAGSYTFAFPVSPGRCGCASTAAMEIQLAADGSGIALEAIEVDGAGQELARLSGGQVFVSPSGRVAIIDTYLELNTPSGLNLNGELTRAGADVTGAGEFSRAADPIVGNTWTTTR